MLTGRCLVSLPLVFPAFLPTPEPFSLDDGAVLVGAVVAGATIETELIAFDEGAMDTVSLLSFHTR